MIRILVVSNDVVGLTQTLSVLGEAGYHVTGASSFEEARQLVATGSTDLVIADQRLGQFNGLHVILRARAQSPSLSAIVTTRASDRGFENEARSLHVECIVTPKNPRGWLAPVAKVLARRRVISCPAAGVGRRPASRGRISTAA